MKFIPVEDTGKRHVLELTRRNLEVLLAKLDAKHDGLRLIAPGQAIEVHAVEDDVHYADRDPGLILINGEVI